jgi:TPR repeat protein
LRRRWRVAAIVAALGLVTASFVWSARGPLAHQLCGARGISSIELSRAKLWACDRGCQGGSARDCVVADDLRNPSTKDWLREDYGVHVPMDQLVDEVGEWEQACARGRGTACRHLGNRLVPLAGYGRYEEGLARMMVAAYRRGCDLDDAPSCTGLGDHLAREEATQWFFIGCSLGDGMGCRRAAIAIQPTFRGPGDSILPRWYFERACQLGCAEGCQDASDIALRDGDPEAARALDLQGCGLGGGLSCKHVAAGSDGGKLPPEVVSAMKSECLLWPADILCYWLGQRLLEGRGVAPDPGAARGLIASSASLAMSRRPFEPPAENLCEVEDPHAGDCYLTR